MCELRLEKNTKFLLRRIKIYKFKNHDLKIYFLLIHKAFTCTSLERNMNSHFDTTVDKMHGLNPKPSALHETDVGFLTIPSRTSYTFVRSLPTLKLKFVKTQATAHWGIFSQAFFAKQIVTYSQAHISEYFWKSISMDPFHPCKVLTFSSVIKLSWFTENSCECKCRANGSMQEAILFVEI